MSGTPHRRSRQPNRADRPATRRSHHAASSSPPATHHPSMAAITGFDSCSRVGPERARRAAGAAGPSGWRRRRTRCSSPVSTATLASGSASKARNSSWRRSAVAPLTALRTAGWSMRTTVHVARPHTAADGTLAAVRVVAGELRGRRLVAPAGTTTRPTSDRVREATFNALTASAPSTAPSVLDLFAGSGALGIEALSRGAAPVHLRRARPGRARGAPRRTSSAHRPRGRTGRSVRAPAPSAGSTARATSPCSTRRTPSTAGTTLLGRPATPQVAVCESDRADAPPRTAGWS